MSNYSDVKRVPSGYCFSFHNVRDLGVQQAYRQRAAIMLQLLRPAAHSGYVCPFCGNGSGRAGTGLEFAADGPHAGKFHCYKCGFHGDIIDIATRLNVTVEVPGRQVNDGGGGGTAEQQAGNAGATDDSQYAGGRHANDMSDSNCSKLFIHRAAGEFPGSEAEQYAQLRGLSADTCKRFNLGYAKLQHIGAALVIPEGDTWYVGRALDPNAQPKTLNARGPVPLFNAAALQAGHDAVVFVTESAICALSCVQAGYPAVALNGCGQAKALFSALSALSADSRPLLALALDRDEAGDRATMSLLDRLHDAGCDAADCRAVLYAEAPETVKDPNDLLVSGSGLDSALERAAAAAREALNAEATEYAKAGERAAAALKIRQDECAAAPTMSCGLPRLDKYLGPWMPGLYVFGALPGAGKTALLLQFARSFSATRDVLLFSLEIATADLAARTVASKCYEIACQKAADDPDHAALWLEASVSADEVEMVQKLYEHWSPMRRELYDTAAALLSDSLARVFIIEGEPLSTGTEYMRSAVERHIRLRGQTPVVVIDYLQITGHDDLSDNKTDKQVVDYISHQLRRIVRDFKTQVFVISSFNRQNYFEGASLQAFKESGGIEYTADVAVALQLFTAEAVYIHEYAAKESTISKVITFPASQVKRVLSRMHSKIIEFNVLKARKGYAPALQLGFDPAAGYFGDEYERCRWLQRYLLDTAGEVLFKAKEATDTDADLTLLIEKYDISRFLLVGNVPRISVSRHPQI